MLESHRRAITVVFCDLRGFTAFSELTEPEEVMAVLREYHAVLGKLIHKYEGTVERFAGDGIMIFFNDPAAVPGSEPARRADGDGDARAGGPALWSNGASTATSSASAWASRTAMQRSAASGSRVGSTTAPIGTVVNLAARLCSDAKDGQILIEGKVQSAIEEATSTEPAGELTLKGHSSAGAGLQRLRAAAGCGIVAAHAMTVTMPSEALVAVTGADAEHPPAAALAGRADRIPQQLDRVCQIKYSRLRYQIADRARGLRVLHEPAVDDFNATCSV